MNAEDATVHVHGHCPLKRQAIMAALREDQAERLVDAGGGFVIVARRPAGDVIITSRSAAVAYHQGPATHGPVMADVAATLPFAWNHRAVADFLVFAHPLGDDTLHPNVRHLPPGTVTTVAGDGGRVDTRPVPEPAPAPAGPDPASAMEVLVEAVRTAAGSECGLSMSGGLDSRVLLAALLSLGHRPTLFVSGVPGSFDREVASAIARHHHLPIVTTQVRERSLWDGARAGPAAGFGLLPLTNRAGLEHLRQAATGYGPPILLGMGGEYARSHYAAGHGLAALRQAAMPGRRAADVIARRFPVPLTHGELAMVDPALRDALDPTAVRDRIESALGAATGSALDRADEFFLSQYARNKISIELASLDGHLRWRAPFLDPAWNRAVRALPRRWKLGSRLHRYCVARLWPPLREFPEAGFSGGALNRRPPPAYWLTGPRHPSGPHYLDQRMFRSERLPDLLREHRHDLQELVEPALLDRLAVEQVTQGRRPHVTYGLLALSLYRRRMRHVAGDGHRTAS